MYIINSIMLAFGLFIGVNIVAYYVFQEKDKKSAFGISTLLIGTAITSISLLLVIKITNIVYTVTGYKDNKEVFKYTDITDYKYKNNAIELHKDNSVIIIDITNLEVHVSK